MPTSIQVLQAIKGNPDPDAKVLWQLAKAGSDLSKVHEPDFAFTVLDKSNAHALAKELSEHGYKSTIYEPDDEYPHYEVVGVKRMVLELDLLNNISKDFEALANKHNGEYLGWGTEIEE